MVFVIGPNPRNLCVGNITTDSIRFLLFTGLGSRSWSRNEPHVSNPLEPEPEPELLRASGSYKKQKEIVHLFLFFRLNVMVKKKILYFFIFLAVLHS